MKDFCPRRSLLLVAALTIGGCAVIPQDDGDEVRSSIDTTAVSHPEVSVEADIMALAGFADTLSLLPVDSQRQEAEQAERDYERSGDTARRLRLGLLLALADDPLRDLDRASELLAESVEADDQTAHGGLARLLATLVAAMQLEQQQQRQLRQSLKQHDDNDLLAAARARCLALEEQLDRLKDIERQINERAQPPALPMDDDED